MWQDLRYSLRTLRHSPAFAVTATIVLALGIGINTAIFSVIYAVLFNPPKVRAPHELRYIYNADPRTWLYYGDYRYLRQSNDVFADLVAVVNTQATVGSSGSVQVITGEAVSGNYFDVLGIAPTMGRGFTPEDEDTSRPRVVVISHQMWLRHFNRDPDIIGKSLTLTRSDIRPADQWPHYTVVGVMAPEFKGVSSPWQPTQFWVPLVQRAFDYNPPPPGPATLPRTLERTGVSVIVARLKPGETDARARVFADAMADQLRHPIRTKQKEWGLIVRDSRTIQLPFDPRRQIVPERLAIGLMTVAGLVLLIATANLAGLLMARGVSRRAELGIRLTLGASRWRIARQLLSESVALACVGGAVGLGLARALIVFFLDQTPTQFGRSNAGAYQLEVPLNLIVFLFTAGLCVAAGLLVGLTPARQASRTDLLTVLGGSTGTASRRTARLRHWIVVPQVCLSLVLLLVAGTLARPLVRAELTPPGYDPNGLVFAEFDLSFFTRPTEEERLAFYARREIFYPRLLERTSKLPGLATTALSTTPPFEPMRSWVIDRDQYPAGRHWWVAHASVSAEYFNALEMSILRGRAFDTRDRRDTPRTAIVCERLARWLWPNQNPIGQYLGRHWPESPLEPEWLEVIGVVNEVQTPLSEGDGNPTIYTSIEQDGRPYVRTILARGSDAPGNLERAMRQAIVESDDTAQIYRSGSASDAIATVRYPRRMAVGILMLSGLMGLLLASMGIYGVVSYSVAQRLREIGIRAALGAGRAQLIRLIVFDGVKVLSIGSVLGLVGAFAAFRAGAKLVAGLPALDATTLFVVPIALAAVILAACYVPARRAGRVDPITVLRNL